MQSPAQPNKVWRSIGTYLLIGILALAGSSCQAGSSPEKTVEGKTEIIVFAAASLTEAFTEIGNQYEASHPGNRVTFNFAGSQQLAQQISQGANADVFASADEEKMQTLVKAGFAEPGDTVFAANRLVIILPKSNPGGIQDLASLAQPGLRIILAAKEVPAGDYALQFLAKASTASGLGEGYQDKVMANVVSYEENVRAVLSKVMLGEADAGIVYATDYTAMARGGNAGKLSMIDIPDRYNVTAVYPVSRLVGSQHPEASQAFIDYLLSEKGRQILSDYGFLAPGEKQN